MRIMVEDKERLLNFLSCNDINPSGIRRLGVSPLIMAMVSTLTYVRGEHVEFRFKNGFPPFTIHTPDEENVYDYLIPAGVAHSPRDWAGGYPPSSGESLFNYLNEKYLTDLRNKRALLLLDQSFEGYHEHWLWDFFHSECVKHGIPATTILYVTGNMIVEEEYKKYADKLNIPQEDRIVVAGYAHFQVDVFLNASNRVNLYGGDPLPNFVDQVEYKTKHTEDIKTYACLNKRLRPQRIWFYSHLYYNNLLDKGLVSMNPYTSDDMIWWEGEMMEGPRFAEPLRILPLEVYDSPNNALDDNYYINRFNPEVCLDTWVSVVPEAAYGDSEGTLFLSEKIFKPIVCHHPFIILGNRGSLAKLREMGYKTFDGFIDESYDELPTWERFPAIIEAIKKVDAIENKLEWFKSMQDIVEHNYQTLKKNVLTEAPPSFNKVYKHYLHHFQTIL